ncbi:MAG TPA: XdhC family protein [Acidimicrobiales bacterium]|nr:XdhC family protein [Acidimicrobiales bacterium]
MKEVIGDIERWRHDGLRVAVARVVGVDGSGPRDPGATMAVNEAGDVAGSVSGGCVEGAVVTEALDAMARGGGARRCTFGYSDDEAFSVGLTCGGTIHVLVDPTLPPVYDSLRRALEQGEPVALATVSDVGPGEVADVPEGGTLESGTVEGGTVEGGTVEGGTVEGGTGPALGAGVLVYADGRTEGTLGDPGLDRAVVADAAGALGSGASSTRHYGRHGQARERSVEVFVEVFAPPPRLVVFGAVDFTAALARVAKVLGYHVTVCDARPVFATAVRFPMADEVVTDRPDRYMQRVGDALGPCDAVCVLTHDPKFDVPAIVAALGTGVGYLGVMGSRRTHAGRLARLADAGVGPDGMARVMAPIGLDIGARTPEETAVAICAEIIAVRSGRPVPSLRDGTGPIHRPPAAGEPA